MSIKISEIIMYQLVLIIYWQILLQIFAIVIIIVRMHAQSINKFIFLKWCLSLTLLKKCILFFSKCFIPLVADKT